jgi:hypothetical protein
MQRHRAHYCGVTKSNNLQHCVPLCCVHCLLHCAAHTAATQFLVKGLHIFAQAPCKDKQSAAPQATVAAAAVSTDVLYMTQHVVHTRAAQLASTFTQFVCTKEDVHYACTYRDSSTAERSSEQSMPTLRYVTVYRVTVGAVTA